MQSCFDKITTALPIMFTVLVLRKPTACSRVLTLKGCSTVCKHHADTKQQCCACIINLPRPAPFYLEGENVAAIDNILHSLLVVLYFRGHEGDWKLCSAARWDDLHRDSNSTGNASVPTKVKPKIEPSCFSV